MVRDQLRAEVRAAHEAMKGMREAEADLRALLAEARRFAAEVVPAEVNRQLDELEPTIEATMRSCVANVIAEFDRIEALLLATKDDGTPSIEDLITARAHRNGNGGKRGAMTCRTCGAPNDAYTALEEGKRPAVPKRGSPSICSTCATVSVFDHSPLGELIIREPTESEATRIAGDENIQNGIKAVRFTRRVIDKSGPQFGV